MPEGDTVFRTAKMLDSALAGRTVTRFEIRTYIEGPDLVGAVIGGCYPVGKHLFLQIGDFSLHSHLKMEGKWHVYPAGQRWRLPGYKARIVIGTEDHEAVGFELAQVQVTAIGQQHLLVQHLGPDVLSAEWGSTQQDEAVRRLRADGRPLHVALLEQRNIAGFGNEYANELCFLAGLNPAVSATEVDFLPILKTGRRAIVANCARWNRTFTGDTRIGRRHYVFGRRGKPCFRCGTLVQKTQLGADPQKMRDVYWCPKCQPPVTDLSTAR